MFKISNVYLFYDTKCWCHLLNLLNLQLYQAYGCKERTKHKSCKSNDYTTNEKFNNCINKEKKQNVQIIILVSIRRCVGLRRKMFGSCIGRNDLVLGILTCVEW